MSDSPGKFTRRWTEVLHRWRNQGIPGREELLELADELAEFGRADGYAGLWGESVPPLLVTATVDDGWGHGIEIINRYSQALGLRTHSLGLLQAPVTVVDYCRLHLPEWLGLTVLQFDSEEVIKWLSVRLPGQTRLILGGPLFRVDPELAERVGAYQVAGSIADFVELMLRTYSSEGSFHGS